MTPSTISQPFNNVPLAAQSGEGFVAKGNFNVNGGNALIGVSASAWSSSPGPISIEVWVDGQPTGQQLGLNASQAAMHLSLGHTWARCDGLSPGQHTIELLAGPTTVTDQNDFVCATVWEMGQGNALLFDYDAPSPTGAGQTLIKDVFQTKGGETVMISATSSGWLAGTTNQQIGSNIWLGAPTEVQSVFANNSNQDLAAVPSDFISTSQVRGQHEVQLNALTNTNTNASDIAHMTIVDWIDPANAPVVRASLQGNTAQSQHGDGGTVVSTPFTCGGGPLLVRTSASAWSSSANVPLVLGIQVDGDSLGFLQLFANPANTHMSMITNNLVLTGIPAGQHTLGVIGEANTITDQNDRVSILIMEFPKS
jgi:hypothetical protein